MTLVKSKFVAVLFIITWAALPAHAAEESGDLASLVSLRIVPENVTLWGAQASQHFTVMGKYADGLERDVTSAARFSLSDAKKGEIDRSGKFVARGSGEVILTAKSVAGRPRQRFIWKRQTSRVRSPLRATLMGYSPSGAATTRRVMAG